jgi:hypothetical protein
MGKQTRLMELPTRMLEVALGSERRWKRVAIGSVVLVGVLGVGAWFAVQELEARGGEALATDVGSLETCLLGAPLAEGEAPDGRVRAVQLGVLGVPRAERAKPGELPWPQRCATFAAAVHDKLGDDDPLGAASAALATAIKEDAPSLEEPVAKVWAAVKAEGITPRRDPAVAPAPAPLAATWSRTEFAKLPTFLGGDFALTSLRFEPSPSKALRFLVDEAAGGGPRLCSIGPADAEATCVPAGAGASRFAGKLSLVGTTDDAATPLVFADGGTGGVFRVTSGETIAAITTHHAYVSAGGDAWLLVGAPAKDLQLLRLAASLKEGAATPPATVAVPDAEIAGPGQAALLFGDLAHQGVRVGQTAHLFVAPVGPAGVGARQDLGAVADPAPDARAAEDRLVDGCRSPGGELGAVRVKGGKSDQVSVRVGGRWSAIFAAGTRAGELVCHATDVTLTEVQHAAADGGRNLATITMSRCAAGCATTTVKLADLIGGTDVVPPDASSLAAADVGGKLALVWSAGHGGVRMRVGSADELKTGRDVLLFDGYENGGANLPSFNGLRLVPFGDRALLFLATKTGVRAFRIDPDGKVTPITAKG